jgi:tryptophan synthase alpha subunit
VGSALVKIIEENRNDRKNMLAQLAKSVSAYKKATQGL